MMTAHPATAGGFRSTENFDQAMRRRHDDPGGGPPRGIVIDLEGAFEGSDRRRPGPGDRHGADCIGGARQAVFGEIPGERDVAGRGRDRTSAVQRGQGHLETAGPLRVPGLDRIAEGLSADRLLQPRGDDFCFAHIRRFESECPRQSRSLAAGVEQLGGRLNLRKRLWHAIERFAHGFRAPMKIGSGHSAPDRSSACSSASW
jgi:hypothetical protein